MRNGFLKAVVGANIELIHHLRYRESMDFGAPALFPERISSMLGHDVGKMTHLRSFAFENVLVTRRAGRPSACWQVPKTKPRMRNVDGSKKGRSLLGNDLLV